jgi:hypothetical protein
MTLGWCVRRGRQQQAAGCLARLEATRANDPSAFEGPIGELFEKLKAEVSILPVPPPGKPYALDEDDLDDEDEDEGDLDDDDLDDEDEDDLGDEDEGDLDDDDLNRKNAVLDSDENDIDKIQDECNPCGDDEYFD